MPPGALKEEPAVRPRARQDCVQSDIVELREPTDGKQTESTHRVRREAVQVELYDHRNDPGGNVNVAADRPEIAQRLIRQLRQFDVQ